MKQFILLALLGLLSPAWGYKILAIFPTPVKSSHHLAQGLVGALLKAGHEVTWATPYPKKDVQKGLTIIDISEAKEVMKDFNPINISNLGLRGIMELDRNLSRTIAKNEALQQAMLRQFDAVVTPTFLLDLPSGFAAVQQVPWIVLVGQILHSGAEMLVDDLRSTALVPAMVTDFPLPMNLWQRMANTAINNMMMVKRLWDFTANEQYYQEIFGPMAKARGVQLPPYADAANNVSILLVNSHPSLAPATSVPPNVVDIAGFHIEDHLSPLPKDIQEIMDNSKNGVIYFSLGSIVKASMFPEQLKTDLIRILGALPYTVLWKFEEPLEGLPKNVHVRPWMPQPAILAHPKTKLFMTHGGLLSTLEAIQVGVPLLAIPVFGDQPANARRAERAGYAVSVPFNAAMGNDLEKALKKILTDNSYSDTAKALSRTFNNRPVPPAKLIAHYVQLAIETKGAYHLRSPTYQYRWYERYMLDQLAVLVVSIYVFVKTIKVVLKLLFGKKKSEKVKEN